MGKMFKAPGFRFKPTDVELLKYFLKRKLIGKKLHVKVISEVDVYKYDPWDLPGIVHIAFSSLNYLPIIYVVVEVVLLVRISIVFHSLNQVVSYYVLVLHFRQIWLG